MRERVRILLVVYGLLLTVAGSVALKPTRPKFKIATTSTTTTTTTTEEPEEEVPEVTTVQTDVNATTGHTLTGIPQIDYVWDPNLPRELNGFNLSSYPFYSTVPDNELIDFKCDGLHDGFYASIQHKCQVYHHCLYGTRYDFLCANFTAFDQRTFICHFASEVDCANSKKYWHRNDALYQATTTTTTSTTTVAPPPTTAPPAPPPGRPAARDWSSNPRRRPFRRRPMYDYYDDEYYDEPYERTGPRGYARGDNYEYDEPSYREPVKNVPPRYKERNGSFGYTPSRVAGNHRPLYEDQGQKEREKIPAGRPGGGWKNRRPVDQYDYDSVPPVRDTAYDPDPVGYPDAGKATVAEERRKESPELKARDSPRDMDDWHYSDKRYRNDYDDKAPAPVATGGGDGLVKPAAPSTSVYARPRAPPKIRRPVPVSEQDKYAYNVSSRAASGTPTEPRRKPDPVNDDYLEDDFEDAKPARRPFLRRPVYRNKEPSYDDTENGDKGGTRNYRTQYQDEKEEEVLPRKRPLPPRDRYYGYAREKPAQNRGALGQAAQYPIRTTERPSGSLKTRPLSREEDFNRPKYTVREREPHVLPSEAPRKSNYYQHRTEKTLADNPPQTYRNQDDEDELEAEEEPTDAVGDKENRGKNTEQKFLEPEVIPEEPLPRPSSSSRGSQKYGPNSSSQSPSGGDYTSGSSSEYYDEPEELPASSPRTTVRVVKRPFLPSRGGNPNPRGLKQVGLRVEPRSEEAASGRPGKLNPANEGGTETSEDRTYSNRRQPYDAYRTIQSDGGEQQRNEAADEDVVAKPQSRRLQKEDSTSGQDDHSAGESLPDNSDNNDGEASQSSQQEARSRDNSEGKKPNEFASRLQDIPESEYDVTLNDALTPNLNQESNLPSGFILPLERDTNLQSSQRNYLFTRPTEPVVQLKSLPSSGSSSYPVPPIAERSRATFPRQSPGSIFAPAGHQQSPWQGYVEY